MNPYILKAREDSSYDSGIPWVKIIGGTAVVWYGGGWALNREYTGAIKDLPYLASFFPAGQRTMFPSLIGREQVGIGTYRFKVIDRLINDIKAVEESFLKIPRTFDIASTVFSKAYSGVHEGKHLYLQMQGEDLQAARKYVESLIGRKLTSEEMEAGLHTSLYNEGKSVGLFVKGQEAGEPLVKNVRVRPRIWNPDFVGQPKGAAHLGKGAQAAQRVYGVEAMSAGRSAYPFLVEGESGKLRVRLESELGSLIGEHELEVPAWAERGVIGAQKVTTSLSNRYFHLMDNPIEVVNEILFSSQSKLLQKFSESPFYQGIVRNRLGTGGKYSGTLLDLWARHAKRAVPLVAGVYAGYKVLESATRTLTGGYVTPGKIAGTGVAAAQLGYTALGEVSGLNTLTRYQESVAPGSTSPMALVGAGLAGGIAASVGEYGYDWYKNRGQDWFWKRRNELINLPEELGFLKKVPGVSKFFENKMSRSGVAFRAGALAGLALMIPMIPGMLGTTTTPEQLKEEFMGDRLVPIHKGRWWELGRTPYEGNDIEGYRPSWYAELTREYESKATYGEYYDKPLTRAFKTLMDPYWVEKMHYWDRPYPITGSKTSGFGPLGTLYDMTIGSLLKPPMYMHKDEWMSGGEQLTIEGSRDLPAYELGGRGPAPAQNPYSMGYAAGDFANKMMGAIGLPGFFMSAAKKELTGTSAFGGGQEVLANASDIDSWQSWYYGREIGGGLTSTEALRRFVPGKKFEVPERNPLLNEMPSWIPQNAPIPYHLGDPYAKISQGVYRLPGAGFEAMHPELRGLDAEDYPDLYKYQILSDIAPDSKEFQFYRQQVMAQAASGEIDPGAINNIEEQRQLESERRRFAPAEGIGLLGHYYRTLVDTARMNPLEYALPISPVHKFMGPTTVEQDYLENQVLSREYASWNTPLQSFVYPTLNVLGHDLGVGGVPDEVQDRRDIEERFDALEYAKARALEQTYKKQGQYWKSQQWASRASRTYVGTDPYGIPGEVEKAFPRDQKAYYRAFKEASVDQQAEMLPLVPSYQKGIYEAALAQTSQPNPVEGGDHGYMVTDSEYQKDFPDYLKEVSAGNRWNNSYARWKGDRKASQVLAKEGIPSDGWVGWNPNVPLQDIKMKVVQNEGYDMHDFNLWESRAFSLGRKPYIDNVAAAKAMSGNRSRSLHDLIGMTLEQHNLPPSRITQGTLSLDSRLDLDVQYDNRKDLRKRMVKEGFLNA